MASDRPSAATSPDGQEHPRAIVFGTAGTGESHSSPATEVPQSIGWQSCGDEWVPVVRVVMTANDQDREITTYGPDGQVLARTYGQVPPPSHGGRRRRMAWIWPGGRRDRPAPPPPLP